MATIGFIGLGHMGLPMAVNLIQAGHQVTGFDLQPAAIESLVKTGGIAATDLRHCVALKDMVITMLQSGSQAKAVYLGEEGVMAFATPKTCLIDCSTIDVETTQTLHQSATTHHFDIVDAPVSGGVAGAKAATLTFMVGGTDSAFSRARPILAAMGKTMIHAGIAGSGQAAKICNNMILASTMIAVSEAFILAKKLGLTPQKLHEVVTHASGQCWVMDKYVPVAGVLENVPANHQYQLGFMTAMMLKDLCLSQSAAATVGIKTPLTEKTTALYQQLQDTGMGALDFSAILKLLDYS